MAGAEILLHSVLEKIAKDEEYVNYKIEVSSANSGGANYTSQLFNVNLSSPGKDELKLFAKVVALSEKLRSITTLQVFQTEILFYTGILSKYREYEDKYNFPEEDRLVLPRYFGGSTEYMKETLVLEELTVKGYQPFDRFKCYDWKYASKCVDILARLHALSIRYEKDDPKLFADMIEKLAFQFPMDEMKDFIDRRVASAIAVTAEENKEWLEKFVQKNFSEESCIIFYNPKRKVCLNHGDFRPSNVMHKRDENGKLEIIVVDYQVLQKGNPVTDLLYFLISGSDEEFRDKHLRQYFDHYYEEFSKTLRRLDVDPDEVYTRADYDGDVDEMLPFGLIIGLFTLPLITVDAEKAPKPEDGIEFESFMTETSELFKVRFNGLVNSYVKMGIV